MKREEETRIGNLENKCVEKKQNKFPMKIRKKKEVPCEDTKISFNNLLLGRKNSP
jgi:hypothetical protein